VRSGGGYGGGQDRVRVALSFKLTDRYWTDQPTERTVAQDLAIVVPPVCAEGMVDQVDIVLHLEVN